MVGWLMVGWLDGWMVDGWMALFLCVTSFSRSGGLNRVNIPHEFRPQFRLVNQYKLATERSALFRLVPRSLVSRDCNGLVASKSWIVYRVF